MAFVLLEESGSYDDYTAIVVDYSEDEKELQNKAEIYNAKIAEVKKQRNVSYLQNEIDGYNFYYSVTEISKAKILRL
jgi:hypothetical protein